MLGTMPPHVGVRSLCLLVAGAALVAGCTSPTPPTPSPTPATTSSPGPPATAEGSPAPDDAGPTSPPAAASPAAPPPEVRTVPPDDVPRHDGAGRLVVTTADGVVSSINPSDGEVEPVAGVTGARQVTPSPDGATLVFTQLDDVGTPVIVVVRDGDVAHRVEVPTPPYFHLVSPDGSRVASLGDAPDGTGVSLLVTDAGDGTSAEVDRGRPYFVSWRADGRRLAANIDATVLTTLDAAGARSPLALTPGAFQAPVWTDDDRLVVVLEESGIDAIPVTSRGVAQPARGALAVVDPIDQSARVLAPVEGAVSLDVSGDRVAWVAGDSDQAASLGPLEVVGLDGSGRTRISDRDVAMFEWSPDGQRLLFQAVDPDQGFVPHVWDGTSVTAYEPFLPNSTLATQYLPFWPQYALALTQWAPDGSAFAYVAADGLDGPGTVVVQALDGQRDEFAPGEMVVWVPDP